MRYLLFTFLLLFTFSGCNDNSQQAKHDAKVAQEAKAEKEALLVKLKTQEEALQKAQQEAKAAQEKLLAQKQAIKEQNDRETQQEKQNEKLSKVGISIKENTITIDTNKTKDFFDNIGKSLGEKLKKITENIDKGMIEDNDAGVKINETHINIDLNKTKDFLETWGKKMQSFVKDIDDMAKELDINNSFKNLN